jgi:hypothetical protein
MHRSFRITKRRIFSSLAVCAVCIGFTGCIDRRFVVETNVPGAQVFVNNRQIGPSPADTGWEHPGQYQFRVVAPGYEPLTECRTVQARWYDYAPLDFFVGVLWPFHIEDVRRFRFDLREARQMNVVEIESKADALRERTKNLPPPSVPDDDKFAKPSPPSTPLPVIYPPN